jgi:hypothetical protein
MIVCAIRMEKWQAPQELHRKLGTSGGLPASKEDDKMEAVIGLFLIVAMVALLSGAGRSGNVDGERPVRYIEVAPSASARSTTATRESGSGSLIAALVLLLTIIALFLGAR